MKQKGPVSAVLAVVIVYALFHFTGIGCPLKFVTGISCAGCGMTRAWFSLCRADIAGAFHYHPLFFLPPLFLLFYLLKKRLGARVRRILMLTCVSLFFIIYLYRLLDRSDSIVVFEPEEGFVFRMMTQLLRKG